MTDPNDPYGNLRVFDKVLVITVNLNQISGVVVGSNPWYLEIGSSHKDPYPTIVSLNTITTIITDPKLIGDNTYDRSAN